MRALSTFLIVFLIGYESFGQIKYEKGYFINNDHQRIECFIKNLDWKYNPVEFSYKLKESGAPEKGNLTSVKEFGIYNYYKFINADVKIDRSINSATSIKNGMAPVWEQEKLFLKVLLEGKAKLYCYDSKKLERFFYSVTDTAINQLIYKEVQNGKTLVKNTSFRQQLWGNLRNPNSNMNLVKNMNYNTKDLENYILSYNRSFGDTITEINKEKKRSYFNLKLTPGLNSSSVSMNVMGDHYLISQLTFKTNQSFRLGLESELIIPFNKYRWGILFEPTFQSFSSETEREKGTASITFNSIEFPIGLRYYIYLNDDIRIYVNAFYIPGFAMNLNSKIEFYINTELEKSFEIESESNTAFGGGVEYKRFSLETRYYTKKNIFRGSEIKSSDYSRLSIILGYKFMKARLK